MRSWIGFKQIGVEYERDARAAGKPKYTLNKLLKLAYDGIFNFSVLPIKVLTWLGILCIVSSLIYFSTVLVKRLMLADDVPIGFTAQIFMIILFGGVQLISLGIIGEYVQRIFFQSKDRPLYIIDKKIISGKEEA